MERTSRKLARESFHAMAVYQAGLERRQGFLFRWVDVAMELYAMAASVSHARRLSELGRPEGARAEELADLFCRGARRKVRGLVRDLWRNDDDRKTRVAEGVMAGQDAWLSLAELGPGTYDEEPDRLEAPRA